ncbi:hypothetical protein NE237_017391 [Protea cynaroides]|uniref:Uncharacterized protein n=1 Tax=Protea cynaroides TaxID=273540 RepID=A0A9Q0K7Y8_9MAGN|nr:hypothetical protein NE237_017391 [Protea cynaroides]
MMVIMAVNGKWVLKVVGGCTGDGGVMGFSGESSVLRWRCKVVSWQGFTGNAADQWSGVAHGFDQPLLFRRRRTRLQKLPSRISDDRWRRRRPEDQVSDLVSKKPDRNSSYRRRSRRFRSPVALLPSSPTTTSPSSSGVAVVFFLLKTPLCFDFQTLASPLFRSERREK